MPHSVHDDEFADVPPTLEEVTEALNQLVADGLAVAVEEINPVTGKIQLRYHLVKDAPKPN